MPHLQTPTKQKLPNSFGKPLPILPSNEVNEPIPKLPPSPPYSVETVSKQVLDILDFLRSRGDGHIPPAWDKPWNNIKLSLEDYERFESILKKDRGLWGYVQDKVRYDWDSKRRTLTFRTPTGIHERFLALLEYDIQFQLDNIIHNSNERVATVARQISSLRSTDLELDGGEKDKRSPDGQWDHGGSHPPLIIEISYSQKRKDLARLADDYIVGSRGAIGTVVGVDMEYRGTKEAQIMEWKLDVIREDEETYIQSKLISNQVFRRSNGDVNPGNFVLHLEDFTCLNFRSASEEDRSTPIIFSHETLSSYLYEAEKMYQIREECRKTEPFQSVISLPPVFKLRFRAKTPPEEINPADEAGFVEAEIAADHTRSEEDDDYDGVGENDGTVRRSSRIA